MRKDDSSKNIHFANIPRENLMKVKDDSIKDRGLNLKPNFDGNDQDGFSKINAFLVNSEKLNLS
jgi:hypothetical protein